MPSPPDTSTVTTLASSRVVTLNRSDCLRLLGESNFGRVAVALGQGVPVIRPLNYVFDEPSQSVAFRTALGSKLHALLHSRDAAFEVDHIDPATRSGWSVIIVGRTEEVTDPAEVRRLEGLGLETWGRAPRMHWVRVRAWTVSGRRIVSAEPAR